MRTIYEILRSKREGQELPKEEIAHLVAGIVSGEVPEYQAAAFLMAAVILGLSTAETAALTRAQVLTQSGVQVLAIANQQPQNVLALLRNL